MISEYLAAIAHAVKQKEKKKLIFCQQENLELMLLF